MGAAADSAADSFGLKPEVKAPNISTMIESAFKSGGTGGWGAAADSAGAVPHEQLMEQYVKDKMGGDEGRNEAEGGEDEAAGKGNMLSEEDRLYTIPEDFKKKVQYCRGILFCVCICWERWWQRRRLGCATGIGCGCNEARIADAGGF